MWKDMTIAWGHKTLHGRTAGSGRKLLLALHGFGNTAAMFRFLLPLQQQYTILALDLPFHGGSAWHSGDILTKEDLHYLVNAVTSMYGVQKISLCGFSIGGRICLKMAELLPERIEQMTLIAPDGLVFSPFYYFVTRTTAGRAMFRQALRKPRRLLSVISFARDRKWISRQFYTFLQHYLQNPHYRQLIINTWLCTSQLIPKPKQTKKQLQRHGITLHLFMGSNDRVIPLRHGNSFAANAANVLLHILPRGHAVPDAETENEIVRSFL